MMTRAFLIVLSVALLVVPAFAGSFTFTTTPEQDAALAAHTESLRGFYKGRLITPQEHLTNVLNAHLQAIQQQKDEAEVREQIRAKRGKK